MPPRRKVPAFLPSRSSSTRFAKMLPRQAMPGTRSASMRPSACSAMNLAISQGGIAGGQLSAAVPTGTTSARATACAPNCRRSAGRPTACCRAGRYRCISRDRRRTAEAGGLRQPLFGNTQSNRSRNFSPFMLSRPWLPGKAAFVAHSHLVARCPRAWGGVGGHDRPVRRVVRPDRATPGLVAVRQACGSSGALPVPPLSRPGRSRENRALLLDIDTGIVTFGKHCDGRWRSCRAGVTRIT